MIIEKMAVNRRSSAAEDAKQLDGMDDPFSEHWAAVFAKVRASSSFAAYQSYGLKTMIVKANDDLRQENLAMQLMKRLQGIFEDAGLKNSIYLRPYEIFITSSNSGMIEFIPDTTSIDALKKRFPRKAGTS
jgi:phosphatidylinositol 4-kinase